MIKHRRILFVFIVLLGMFFFVRTKADDVLSQPDFSSSQSEYLGSYDAVIGIASGTISEFGTSTAALGDFMRAYLGWECGAQIVYAGAPSWCNHYIQLAVAATTLLGTSTKAYTFENPHQPVDGDVEFFYADYFPGNPAYLGFGAAGKHDAEFVVGMDVRAVLHKRRNARRNFGPISFLIFKWDRRPIRLTISSINQSVSGDDASRGRDGLWKIGLFRRRCKFRSAGSARASGRGRASGDAVYGDRQAHRVRPSHRGRPLRSPSRILRMAVIIGRHARLTSAPPNRRRGSILRRAARSPILRCRRRKSRSFSSRASWARASCG